MSSWSGRRGGCRCSSEIIVEQPVSTARGSRPSSGSAPQGLSNVAGAGRRQLRQHPQARRGYGVKTAGAFIQRIRDLETLLARAEEGSSSAKRRQTTDRTSPTRSACPSASSRLDDQTPDGGVDSTIWRCWNPTTPEVLMEIPQHRMEFPQLNHGAIAEGNGHRRAQPSPIRLRALRSR